MGETPLLSSLREPPVVGRFYMVPTVRWVIHGWLRNWPVLGPLHEDGEDLKFPYLHFHHDGRFLSREVLRYITPTNHTFETALAGSVLSETKAWAHPAAARGSYGEMPRTPTLRRMKCQRPGWTYSETARTIIAKRVGSDRISERLGPIAEPIRLRDGRLLCPHRKVDLGSFPPDENGIVTCPLHGLRVRCATVRGNIDRSEG